MKTSRLITLFLLIASSSLHGQQADYEVGIYSDRNGFISGSTLTGSVLYLCVDLRLVNQFELEGHVQRADDLLNRFIALEQQLGFSPIYHVYSYILNERKLLRDSAFPWVFDSVKELLLMVSNRLSNGQFTIEDVPYSMIRGGLYYRHTETMTNGKAVEYLNDIARMSDIQIGRIIPAENGFTIELRDSKTHKTEWYLYARQIKQSIFPSLNNKYEISAVFYPGDEISQESYSEWQGTDTAKLLIYGELAKAGQFQIGDTLRVLDDTIAIYKSADLSNDPIGSIRSGDELTITAIGGYEVVDGVGGDWIQVETSIGSGRCFASPFKVYYKTREYVG